MYNVNLIHTCFRLWLVESLEAYAAPLPEESQLALVIHHAGETQVDLQLNGSHCETDRGQVGVVSRPAGSHCLLESVVEWSNLELQL